MIDYVTISYDFVTLFSNLKAILEQTGSDHDPVICTYSVKLKKITKAMIPQRMNFASLTQSDTIKTMYNIEVRNRFELLADNVNKCKYEIFKEVISETAKVVIPLNERQSHQKWMTEEILSLMDTRRKLNARDPKEYKKLDKRIRKMCSEAKEKWLNEKCQSIEKDYQRNSNKMYERIKEVIGNKKMCTSSGCIRCKSGDVIMEKQQIMERWTEYVTDLFDDARGEKPSIKKELGGPKILKSEVRNALNKIKPKKRQVLRK
jgi:hypothetical protein